MSLSLPHLLVGAFVLFIVVCAFRAYRSALKR